MTRPEHFYATPTEPITDILAHWESKPLTWSQYSAWRASKPTWYERYVLGRKHTPPALQRRKMDFGNEVGDRIETDITCAPQIERLKYFELELSTVFAGVPIAGHLDNAEPPNRIHEFKTGGLAYPWTQAKVDKHGQLTIYAALMWLVHKAKPEDIDIRLFWLPTEDVEDTTRLIDTPPVAFRTTRTTTQVLTMLKDFTRARREMREYVVHRLSTDAYSPSGEYGIQWD